MRKVVWVVMGLAVAAMAVGFASQRHLFDPQPRTRIITSSSAPSVAAPSVTVPPAPPSATRRTPDGTPPATRSTRFSWKTLDTVVNVLNIVIGIAGIWMTVHGMRMQRMALAADSQRGR